MTVLPFPLSPARNPQTDALSEARAFVQGRDQVRADELADHFRRRGWSMGPQRAGHLLLALGWTGQTYAGGQRVFRRPSPIADGSWRRPWLQPALRDPDQVASEDRRRRWNFAVTAFAFTVAAYGFFLLTTGRL